MELVKNRPELKEQFDLVENSYLLLDEVILEKRQVLKLEVQNQLLNSKSKELLLKAWNRVPNTVNSSILKGINRARKEFRPKLAAILVERENQRIDLELQKQKEEEEKRQKALMEEFKRKERIRKEKEEEERRQKEVEERRLATVAASKPSVSSGMREDVQAGLLRQGLYLVKRIVELNPNSKDDVVLNLVRKTIRTSLGQVTNDSESIVTHTAIVDDMLGKAKEKGPSHYLMALNMFAKLVMAQASTELISNPHMAFPLARLVLALINSNVDILPLLLIRFYKRVPYIYPRSLPKLVEGTEVYFQRLDFYYRDEHSAYEDTDRYEMRVEGIFRLYCCMIQFDVTDGYRVNLGIESSWIWLKNFTSIQPPPLIASTLLNTFFETVGKQFVNNYHFQAIKFIRTIYVDYLPKLNPKAVAFNTKFQVTLDSFFANKCTFKPPNNRNFTSETPIHGLVDSDEEEEDDPYGLNSISKKW